MQIYPAIDLFGGRVAFGPLRANGPSGRLAIDPVEVAARYRIAGAQWIHVVDMDRALATGGDNTATIEAICAMRGVHVQVGGNITDDEYAKAMIARGAARVVVGTEALAQRARLTRLLAAVPTDRAAAAVDVRAGRPLLPGSGVTGVTVHDLVQTAVECGIHTLVFRDRGRDGMLAGAALDSAARIVREYAVDVVVAGGVANVTELVAARDAGLAGVIVGRALHEGRFTLEEAMACSA